jgi:sulfur relay (sulfurtransferase) complex TusBCD TusD component (DsrE family)
LYYCGSVKILPGTLGILLTSGPYTYQHSDTFFDLALAALKKGHSVKAFLYVDGVHNAKLDQDPSPERPMNEKFQELADRGVIFHACGLCTLARGYGRLGEDFIEGVEVTGLTEFAEIVGECDKLVSFSI